MSSNIREVKRELEELERKLRDVRAEVKQAKEGIHTLNAYMSLLTSLGLSTDHATAMSMMRSFMVQAQALYAILVALQAVSGPLGWLQLIAGAGALGVSYANTVEMGMRTR